RATSAIVLLSASASSATWALNAAEWWRRGLLLMSSAPVIRALSSPMGAAYPLCDVFSFARPALHCQPIRHWHHDDLVGRHSDALAAAGRTGRVIRNWSRKRLKAREQARKGTATTGAQKQDK